MMMMNGVWLVWCPLCMLRIPCTFKVIPNITLNILTAHDFTPDHCAKLKFSSGLFFLLVAHQRVQLSLSLNEELDLSFSLSLGVGLLLSIRKINTTNSLCRKRNSIFGNVNVVGTSNHNFQDILVSIWYAYLVMLPLNENWDLPFLVQNLHSYKVNNQWVKFDKNLSEGAILEGWPQDHTPGASKIENSY